MTYTVEVTREDDAWIADVVDLPGAHTYAGNLSALETNVREVLALVLDLPDDEPVPAFRYEFRNVSPEFVEAAQLGDERQELDSQQVQLGVRTVIYASKLSAQGWSVRDTAGALRISPGRVSQLLSKTKH